MTINHRAQHNECFVAGVLLVCLVSPVFLVFVSLRMLGYIIFDLSTNVGVWCLSCGVPHHRHWLL